MAVYKYPSHFIQNQGGDFDVVYSPGETAIHSGIYKCNACGDEIAANKLQSLPPQNHHQHVDRSRPVRWQLIMAAVQQA